MSYVCMKNLRHVRIKLGVSTTRCVTSEIQKEKNSASAAKSALAILSFRGVYRSAPNKRAVSVRNLHQTNVSPPGSASRVAVILFARRFPSRPRDAVVFSSAPFFSSLSYAVAVPFFPLSISRIRPRVCSLSRRSPSFAVARGKNCASKKNGATIGRAGGRDGCREIASTRALMRPAV